MEAIRVGMPSAAVAAVLHELFDRIDRDYAWLLGMILPTEIRMLRVPLSELHRMADAARGT